MITKMPVRLTTLAQLNLNEAKTLWDIGFCTASVSIEARLQFPHLKIMSFEKRPECSALFDINTTRFRAPGIVKVMGDFFEQDLSSLTKGKPVDAAFIGGHGGRLTEMLDRLTPFLSSGARVAINAVQQETLHQFKEYATQKEHWNLSGETAIMVGTHNPISILIAEKR